MEPLPLRRAHPKTYIVEKAVSLFSSLGGWPSRGAGSVNTDFSVKWPNITRKGTPPPDADDWKEVPDKYAKYFTPNPGKGE